MQRRLARSTPKHSNYKPAVILPPSLPPFFEISLAAIYITLQERESRRTNSRIVLRVPAVRALIGLGCKSKVLNQAKRLLGVRRRNTGLSAPNALHSDERTRARTASEPVAPKGRTTIVRAAREINSFFLEQTQFSRRNRIFPVHRRFDLAQSGGRRT